MPIQMSYSQARQLARSTDLIQALAFAKLSFTTAYRIRKILDKVGMAVQEMDHFEHKLQYDLAQKYAERDEKGEIKTFMPEGKTSEDDRCILFTEENQSKVGAEIFKEMAAFGKKQLTIEWDKVDFSRETFHVRIADLPMLDLIVKDLDEGKPSEETVTKISEDKTTVADVVPLERKVQAETSSTDPASDPVQPA